MVKRSDPGKPREIGGSSLAESVAHELNNIAASLFGFVELAAEEVDPGLPVLRCLGEIRIGVSRVRNLATVLEALAEVDGNSTRIAIGECVGGNAPLDSGGGLRFDWKCDPATLVDADPVHATHVAGGHVALDAAHSSISLVLPAAPPAKLRTTS
jgi:hypothetical protein